MFVWGKEVQEVVVDVKFGILMIFWRQRVFQHSTSG